MKKICVIVGIIGALLIIGAAGGGDTGELTGNEVLIRGLVGFGLIGLSRLFYPKED